MASEEYDDGGVSFAVPPDVGDWIDDQVEGRDENRGDVCRRILVAAHALATDDSIGDPVEREELAALRAQIEAQREEFADVLEDVRGRVVQVKREADGKAPADHEHPSADAAEGVAALATDLERLAADLDGFEERVDAGFDNFEGILEHLLEETEALSERSTVLASAVVDLRERRSTLLDRDRERAAADSIKLAANRLGVRTAACGECETIVDVALLTEPACPHCASSFGDVEARRWFLGSHTLVTGDPPALPGRSEGDSGAGDDLFEGIADEVDDDA